MKGSFLTNLRSSSFFSFFSTLLHTVIKLRERSRWVLIGSARTAGARRENIFAIDQTVWYSTATDALHQREHIQNPFKAISKR